MAGSVLTPEQQQKLAESQAAEKAEYARQKAAAKAGKVKSGFEPSASPLPPQSEHKGIAPTVTDQVNVMKRRYEKIRTDDGSGN